MEHNAPAKKERTTVVSFLPPAELYQTLAGYGETKCKSTIQQCLVLSFLAGTYVGFGACLMVTVGGQLLTIQNTDPGLKNIITGLFGLPYGLSMVIIMGSELVTGNFMYMVAARWEGRCTWCAMLLRWFLNWWGNFVGSLCMVMLIRYSGIWDGKMAEKTIMAISIYKTSESWTQLIVRGILCNWLVCIACSFAASAQDISGKIIGIFLPISAFIAFGFEHCVANMTFIPLGMAYGSGVTVAQLFGNNLVAVTIGNLIGGAFFVATPYALSYGSGFQRLQEMVDVVLCRPATKTSTPPPPALEACVIQRLGPIHHVPTAAGIVVVDTNSARVVRTNTYSNNNNNTYCSSNNNTYSNNNNMSGEFTKSMQRVSYDAFARQGSASTCCNNNNNNNSNNNNNNVVAMPVTYNHGVPHGGFPPATYSGVVHNTGTPQHSGVVHNTGTPQHSGVVHNTGTPQHSGVVHHTGAPHHAGTTHNNSGAVSTQDALAYSFPHKN